MVIRSLRAKSQIHTQFNSIIIAKIYVTDKTKTCVYINHPECAHVLKHFELLQIDLRSENNLAGKLFKGSTTSLSFI